MVIIDKRCYLNIIFKKKKLKFKEEFTNAENKIVVIYVNLKEHQHLFFIAYIIKISERNGINTLKFTAIFSVCNFILCIFLILFLSFLEK